MGYAEYQYIQIYYITCNLCRPTYILIFLFYTIMLRVSPLRGNDREISNYTTAVAR
jgi:hypothetical protein